jgi:hypothetical protein
VGDTLTCSTGVWNNAPTRYDYAWRHVASSEIGLSAPTLPLMEGDVDKLVTCRVTPFNAAGSSYADAEAVGPITETR